METLLAPISHIGEEISTELGSKMVKDFQDSFPEEPKAYFVGRNIIEKLLDTEGSSGIMFFNSLDELGNRTLVYTPLDEKGRLIHPTIVADRSSCPCPHEAWDWWEE